MLAGCIYKEALWNQQQADGRGRREKEGRGYGHWGRAGSAELAAINCLRIFGGTYEKGHRFVLSK